MLDGCPLTKIGPALFGGACLPAPPADCCSNVANDMDDVGGDADPLALPDTSVTFGDAAALPDTPAAGEPESETLADDDAIAPMAASDGFDDGLLSRGTSNTFDGALGDPTVPSGPAPKTADEPIVSGVGVVLGMKQIDDSFLANQQLHVEFLPIDPGVHVVMFTHPVGGSAMGSFEHSVQQRPPSHGSIDTMLSGARLGASLLAFTGFADAGEAGSTGAGLNCDGTPPPFCTCG